MPVWEIGCNSVVELILGEEKGMSLVSSLRFFIVKVI